MTTLVDAMEKLGKIEGGRWEEHPAMDYSICLPDGSYIDLCRTHGRPESAERDAIVAAVNFLREHGPVLLPSQQYAEANPLGGPASMLETAARRIRAGEDFHEVLADYDLHSGAALLRDAGDAARYRWLRDEAMKRQFNGQKGEGVFIAHGSPYTGFCAPTRSRLDEIVDTAMHAPGG